MLPSTDPRQIVVVEIETPITRIKTATTTTVHFSAFLLTTMHLESTKLVLFSFLLEASFEIEFYALTMSSMFLFLDERTFETK